MKQQKQQFAIEYLREVHSVLREQLGQRRPRLINDQRAAGREGMRLCRRILRDVAGIVTRETLLTSHRKLIAKKYDGAARRGQVDLAPATAIEPLMVRMATENRDWGCRRILGALSRILHGTPCGCQYPAEAQDRAGSQAGTQETGERS